MRRFIVITCITLFVLTCTLWITMWVLDRVESDRGPISFRENGVQLLKQCYGDAAILSDGVPLHTVGEVGYFDANAIKSGARVQGTKDFALVTRWLPAFYDVASDAYGVYVHVPPSHSEATVEIGGELYRVREEGDGTPGQFVVRRLETPAGEDRLRGSLGSKTFSRLFRPGNRTILSTPQIHPNPIFRKDVFRNGLWEGAVAIYMDKSVAERAELRP